MFCCFFWYLTKSILKCNHKCISIFYFFCSTQILLFHQNKIFAGPIHTSCKNLAMKQVKFDPVLGTPLCFDNTAPRIKFS